MSNEIIAIGGGCIDHLSIVKRTPDGWEECGVPLVQGGGPAATGATAIARLGTSVELWAFTGDDYHGQMIRTELERDGVDISQIRVVPGYRSHCSYIEVDAETGERTIYGSGFGMQPADINTFYDPERASRARALLVTAFVPEIAIEAAKQVHANGGKVVADLFRVDGPVSEMVHHVDAIILPEFTVEPLVGSFDIPGAACAGRTGRQHARSDGGPQGLLLPGRGRGVPLPGFPDPRGRYHRLRRLVPWCLYLRHGQRHEPA